MALSKNDKQLQVNEIKEKLQKAQSVILVSYSGIKVSEDTELRAKCREAGVEYKVYKNRLIKIAMNELGITECDEDLKESTALAFSYDDVVAPARVVNEQMKTVKVLKFKSGIVEGKKFDENGVKALASIPSKEVLLAQILGLLQGTISGLARSLALVAEKKEN